MAALQFVGGYEVETPQPTIEDLKHSARSWVAMATINKEESERLLDVGDLIRADQQLDFAARNIVRAREQIAEALTMRGGR